MTVRALYSLPRIAACLPSLPRRRSVAMFLDGNYDAVIECLPTCRAEGEPTRYPSVVAGEHLIAKVLGPRTLSASVAIDTAGDRLRADLAALAD